MKLYYIHDPMCSWCWGFRPTWKEICSKLPKSVKVEYLLGGLAPDSNEPMPESLQKDIASYWLKIQKHIPGTEFNYDFWKKCQPRRSTYPACRAVIAAKNQDTNIEKEIIEAIQKAYYLNAQNPSDDDTLIGIAKSLNLNTQAFAEDLNAPHTQQQLEKEILFGRQIGAQGFPSMILERSGHYEYIPLDYNDADNSLKFIIRDRCTRAWREKNERNFSDFS